MPAALPDCCCEGCRAFTPLAQHRQGAVPAQLLRHRATGAQLLRLRAVTDEPVFVLSYPTRHSDDSGAAHVLEHMVFRGARSLPCDQLHSAMTTQSLASHINALTGPDRTAYQLAGPEGGDLRRLAALMMEASLDPALTPAAFGQEVAIITREMQALMGDPASALMLGLRRALLGAGHPAGYNQGGRPGALAGLTLDQLRAFHGASHTAAQARIVVWDEGNDCAWAQVIDQALCAAPGGGAGAQGLPPLPPPRPDGADGRVDFAGLIPPGAPQTALGWLMPEATKAVDLWLLQQVLTGSGPSLLRDVPGICLSGPASGVLEGPAPMFALTLQRGADPDLLTGRLSSLAEGPDPAAIAPLLAGAALAFADSDSLPRFPPGLQMINRILPEWYHRDAPFAALEARARLQDLTADPARAVQWLKPLLRHLRDSPDRVVLQLRESEAPKLQTAAPASASATAAPALTRLPGAAALPPVWPGQSVQMQEGLVHLAPAADGLARIALALQGAADPALWGLQLHEALQERLAGHCRNLQALPWSGAEGARGLILRLTCQPADLATVFRSLEAVLRADLPGVTGDSRRGALLQQMIRMPQQVIAGRLAAHVCKAAAAFDEMAGPGSLLRSAPAGGAQRSGGRVMGLAISARDDSAARAFLADWPPGPPLAQGPGAEIIRGAEGFVLPVPLATAGLAIARPAELSDALARVALQAIETGWLWPQIRVGGGAYGLRSGLDPRDVLWMFSARDPQPQRSLAIMRGAAQWLQSAASPDLLQDSRQGAAARLLRPLAPRDQLLEALTGALEGQPPSAAAQRWSEMLAVDVADLRRAGERLQGALQTADAVLFGPRDLMPGGVVLRDPQP